MLRDRSRERCQRRIDLSGLESQHPWILRPVLQIDGYAGAIEQCGGIAEHQDRLAVSVLVLATTGWSRELWIDALGLPAVLPPREEGKDVKTAIGAARAKSARDQML